MALATRCPACSTVFRISTAQAAAKGGMVRCGQCNNVFNSLDALVRVEDLEILDEASVATPTGESAPAAAVPSPAPVENPSVVEDFQHTETSGVLAGLSTPTDPDAQIQEWWMPVRPATRRNARVASGAAAAAMPMVTAPAAPLVAAADPPWSGLAMRHADGPDPARTTARWIWGVLGLLAAILLAAQCAYLWRDEIAVRWPPARPWLAAACRPLDCVVDYPARVDAVTIESASVQAAAAGPNLYVLTALLRNRDATEVRYPHLELTLTDTNDRAVLRRVLRPEDYLAALRDRGDRIGPAFAAQSELSVRVTFELSNLRFAGYRLDRFYP